MRVGRFVALFVMPLCISACVLAVSLTPRAAHAGLSPDKPVVYNHITSAGAPLDQLIHQTFDAEFKVVDFSDLDGAYVPPQPKGASMPSPPLDEKGIPIEGQVIVFYIVTTEGRVMNPVVIRSSDPRLNARVVEAMVDWTFEPARVKGQVASTTAAQEFELKAAK